MFASVFPIQKLFIFLQWRLEFWSLCFSCYVWSSRCIRLQSQRSLLQTQGRTFSFWIIFVEIFPTRSEFFSYSNRFFSYWNQKIFLLKPKFFSYSNWIFFLLELNCFTFDTVIFSVPKGNRILWEMKNNHLEIGKKNCRDLLYIFMDGKNYFTVR